MTFQLSDDEARQVMDLLGRITKSELDHIYEADVEDPELDITEGTRITREGRSLMAWKMIDTVYCRLNERY